MGGLLDVELSFTEKPKLVIVAPCAHIKGFCGPIICRHVWHMKGRMLQRWAGCASGEHVLTGHCRETQPGNERHFSKNQMTGDNFFHRDRAGLLCPGTYHKY